MNKKQQVLIIHGGNTFDNYEKYIQFLKEYSFNIEKLRQKKDWKDLLQDKLGYRFDVLQPCMPNKVNAQYKEWKIWFEKIISIIDDNVIFIGHSLGGIFLVKYLSENIYPKTIKALFVISAPFNDEGLDEPLGSFRLNKPLENIQKQVGRIFLYHSKDDDVVPFSQMSLYKKLLPKAIQVQFEDRGHFKQEEFPELVKDIQTL